MSVNTQSTKHRGVLGLIKLYLRNIDNYPSCPLPTSAKQQSSESVSGTSLMKEPSSISQIKALTSLYLGHLIPLGGGERGSLSPKKMDF